MASLTFVLCDTEDFSILDDSTRLKQTPDLSLGEVFASRHMIQLVVMFAMILTVEYTIEKIRL